MTQKESLYDSVSSTKKFATKAYSKYIILPLEDLKNFEISSIKHRVSILHLRNVASAVNDFIRKTSTVPSLDMCEVISEWNMLSLILRVSFEPCSFCKIKTVPEDNLAYFPMEGARESIIKRLMKLANVIGLAGWAKKSITILPKNDPEEASNTDLSSTIRHNSETIYDSLCSTLGKDDIQNVKSFLEEVKCMCSNMFPSLETTSTKTLSEFLKTLTFKTPRTSKNTSRERNEDVFVSILIIQFMHMVSLC